MQMNKSLRTDLTLATLFQAPSIRALAERIQQMQGETGAGSIRSRASRKVAALLSRLDQLSDAEVNQLLQQIDPA